MVNPISHWGEQIWKVIGICNFNQNYLFEEAFSNDPLLFYFDHIRSLSLFSVTMSSYDLRQAFNNLKRARKVRLARKILSYGFRNTSEIHQLSKVNSTPCARDLSYSSMAKVA